ncbi:uncharacterized protein PgNI_07501, partial [Pyricularia grisea]|uniref:Uncharacterized protein n=1 Tax=Pyricularia grisea TaxID=148305 RepID=A0A6P8B052_PYRGI
GRLSILGFIKPNDWVSDASLGNMVWMPTYFVHNAHTRPGNWPSGFYHPDVASISSPETKTDIAGIRVLARKA